MKDLRKTIPSILVSEEEFASLCDPQTHLYKMPLNEKNLRILPKAYPDATGTILIFPVKDCPKQLSFRTRESKLTVRRDVLNIMAYKMEDGSEIIKVRMK